MDSRLTRRCCHMTQNSFTLVKRSERILFAIACIFAGLLWLAIIIPSSGGMIPFILFFWLIHLTVRSSMICHFKGNGVHINQNQFPSIYQAIAECTKQLGMKKQPQAYINNGNGVLNAFATHFLRTKYIILNSNVIDALLTRPDALKFYIGHELGHIRRRHSIKRLFIILATWIPIFGAAYARACEYTCDRHGLYCCTSIEEAQIALTSLAAGQNNWQDINIDVLLEQTKLTGKFWMTFNELTQSHPWLSKRIVAIRTLSSNEQMKLPRRNLFAMLFAGLIPNVSKSLFINLIIAVYALGLIYGVTLDFDHIKAHWHELRQHEPYI